MRDAEDAVTGAELAVREAREDSQILAFAYKSMELQSKERVRLAEIDAELKAKQGSAETRLRISPGVLFASTFAFVVVGGTLVLTTFAIAVAAPAVAVSTVVVYKLYREAFPQRKPKKIKK